MDNEIYKEELMDVYRNPLNKGKLDNPSVSILERNPMCGDEINLQLSIKDGVVSDVKFDGSACAISIISSSLVTEDILGKKVNEIRDYDRQKLLDLVGLNLSTSRVKCATLVLTALQKAIKQYDSGKK
ncbi:iron-sulfur cluster assembly scaffold protein [candidate division WWE3 bacterium]|jgi:nitrogen fixation NifU-like protein|uniref:Iron-sulfur cluster assembly scaffold protein n=1 Tax=candidate division WWE3 bacterium TaxID=2053526 RepID=A0A3A4ZJS6_UNCKA|nr:MAG: iron-sulfur cluster assembly scaffold protein [candidate division WWE3 bacterium]